MAPLPISIIVCELGAAVLFGLVLDGIKIPVFARLGISRVAAGETTAERK